MDVTPQRRPDILQVLRPRPVPASGIALEDSGRSVTYASLPDQVTAIAGALMQRGVQRGDRVAVALPNSAVSVEIFLACAVTRGGITVNAAELDTLLSGLSGVREVAVVGQEHPRLGERIVAFVEPEVGRECDVETMRRNAANVLGHGKVPDAFVIVEALPRNAMGKVARPALAALLALDGLRE